MVVVIVKSMVELYESLIFCLRRHVTNLWGVSTSLSRKVHIAHERVWSLRFRIKRPTFTL